MDCHIVSFHIRHNVLYVILFNIDQTSSTEWNAQSSRSHTILTLYLTLDKKVNLDGNDTASGICPDIYSNITQPWFIL